MHYDPGEMAEAVRDLAKALRTVPMFVPEFESAQEFAARMRAWRLEHTEAIKDAENPWMSEIEKLLRQQAPYTK